AAERERGWRAALAEAGAVVPEPVRGDWGSRSGAAAAVLLGDATAVFAANDQMALGLLHGFADLGRRVPNDVAVVGFDDVPEAVDYLPPLTTVRQDFDALAERAVSRLIDLAEGAGPRDAASDSLAEVLGAE
ncbi:MAG: substrate-binding domain-containing protein, partial [Microbacterium chocolatum]|nr:substrate-binding domain-containing protein [Microbacterium chocolatum]